MIFTVAYRNAKTGERDTLELDVADRTALWAALKERGITSAISVTEGKVKGGSKSGGFRRATPSASGPAWVKGAVAGLVVVAAAIVAWLYLAPNQVPSSPEDTKPKTKPVQTTPKTTLPKIEPKPVEKPQLKVEEKLDKKALLEKKKAEYVKKPGQLMLPDGQILTFPPPTEGNPRTVYAYGHSYLCDHLGNFTDITPRQLFHTAFEANFLGLAIEGKPFIPAFLTGLDENDVVKMLQKPYVPIGDETDDEKAQLEAYDAMRNAALQYLEEGGKFDDFVNDFAKFEKSQRQARAMGLREVMTLVKEGKIEEAKTMAKAADLLMSEKGFKPIKLPAYVQEAFDKLP